MNGSGNDCIIIDSINTSKLSICFRALTRSLKGICSSVVPVDRNEKKTMFLRRAELYCRNKTTYSERCSLIKCFDDGGGWRLSVILPGTFHHHSLTRGESA